MLRSEPCDVDPVRRYRNDRWSLSPIPYRRDRHVSADAGHQPRKLRRDGPERLRWQPWDRERFDHATVRLVRYARKHRFVVRVRPWRRFAQGQLVTLVLGVAGELGKAGKCP